MSRALNLLILGVVAALFTALVASGPHAFPGHLIISSPPPHGGGGGGGTVSCDIGPSYTGATPAGATQAFGSNAHCAANYDFTQTTSFNDVIGTHQWSNYSTWVNCSGSRSTPYLFRGSQGVCDTTTHIVIGSDGGTQVLKLTYNSGDASGAGQNPIMTAIGPGSNPDNIFPQNVFTEWVMRPSTLDPSCSGGFCLLVNFSYFRLTSDPAIGSDIELDDNHPSNPTVMENGMSNWTGVNPCCAGTAGGSNEWNQAIGPTNALTNLSGTTYSTYGSLFTSDNCGGNCSSNSGNYAICGYQAAGIVSGLPGSAWQWCSYPTMYNSTSTGSPWQVTGGSSTVSTAIFQTRNGAYFSWGDHNIGATFVAYVQRVTVWTGCPGSSWETGTLPQGCFTSPVVTTHP